MQNKYVTLSSAERGRILDVNGNVLVDNVGVKTIVFNNGSGASSSKLIDISYKIASVIDIDDEKITETKLKKFYLLIKNCDDLITDDEYQMYEERKLDSDDIYNLKLSRITDEMLSELAIEDRKASVIYYLLNIGYSYQDKVIEKDISDETAAKIEELNIPGVSVVLTWERIYLYDTALNSIFGTISEGLPAELASYYLDKGLRLDSTVGVSYLEYQYDEYLRGEDAVYKVNEDNTLTLVSEEKQGNDLYLTIDIEMQLSLESIMKEQMALAKKAKNTEYYNHSYVIIGNPKTGGIYALCGLQIIDDHFVDITSNIISSSYTVGSVVKGATISVGYANGLVTPGEYVTDSCIKVKNVKEKCSWKSLGRINDLDALAYSSNYFQFLIATKLTNPAFAWNSSLNATEEDFNIYREMLASFGLGSLTGIDLPGETTGIIGKTVSDDLLLNLAIGQYDTYTPIELFQYINTIANDGKKVKPHLLSKIANDKETLLDAQTEVISTVSLDLDYIKRMQEGLHQVMVRGTGRNYTNNYVSSAGKTGTSETFIDTDGDNVMDTKTTSSAFVMYAPFEDPEYSIVILSPNISHESSSSSYKYSINLRINREIMNFLFIKDIE